MFKSLLIFATLAGPAFAQTDGRLCDDRLVAVAVISTNPDDLLPPPSEELAHRKVLFETSFSIRARTQDAAWEQVIAHAHRWALRISYLKAPQRAALRLGLAESNQAPFRQILLNGEKFKLAEATTRFTDGRRKSWALIVEHPDHRDRRLLWRVDLALSLGADDAVHLTTSTSISHSNPNQLRAFPILSSRPALVEKILADPALQAFSGTMPMATTAFVVHALPDLLAAINDPDRALPLVYVSRELHSGLPLVDVDALARHLRGFATVALESPIQLSRAVPTDALGKLRAYQGDIRVIGPDAENLGVFRPASGATQDEILVRVGRMVVRTNMDRVRLERKGWVGSIFELL